MGRDHWTNEDGTIISTVTTQCSSILLSRFLAGQPKRKISVLTTTSPDQTPQSPLNLKEVGNDIEEQSDEFDPIVEDATEDDGFDVAPLQNVVEKLYVPEAILARQTQFLTRKKRGKFGTMNSTVVGWVDRYQIHWKGFSIAEST